MGNIIQLAASNANELVTKSGTSLKDLAIANQKAFLHIMGGYFSDQPFEINGRVFQPYEKNTPEANFAIQMKMQEYNNIFEMAIQIENWMISNDKQMQSAQIAA